MMLRAYTVLTALATFFLIIAGALVTSTGSGLAVPDWPLSYGMVFPPMVGGIFYEHGHRMVATFVGMLTIGLAVWLARKEDRKSVRAAGWIALLAVVTQGILGGLTVIFLLPTPISVSHAALGQTFFVLVSSIAFVSTKTWKRIEREGDVNKSQRRLSFLSVFLVFMVFGQLLLGAVMRHTGAGLAIPDFPLHFGRILPPEFSASIAIHFAHRIWGFVLSAYILFVFIHVLRFHRSDRMARNLSFSLFFLVLLQVALGAFTIWYEKAVPIVTSHVAVGALIYVMSVFLALYVYARFGVRFERLGNFSSQKGAYLQLTKPRITAMVCITTAIGFYLGSAQISFALFPFLAAVLTTALGAAGASTLNQFLERTADSKMARTKMRPIPSGRLQANEAFYFGFSLCLLSLLAAGYFLNSLAFVLLGATIASYLFLYTPLKARTPFCTVVGAIPGAIPPLIGWAAARGQLDPAAWALFGILFLWQLPHFWAIAWLYKEDYRAAGYPMLPVLDPTGKMTSRQIIYSSLALIVVATLPVAYGIAGFVYLIGAMILGIAFLLSGVLLVKHRSPKYARASLLASVTYLPLLLILMAIDRI